MPSWFKFGAKSSPLPSPETPAGPSPPKLVAVASISPAATAAPQGSNVPGSSARGSARTNGAGKLRSTERVGRSTLYITPSERDLYLAAMEGFDSPVAPLLPLGPNPHPAPELPLLAFDTQPLVAPEIPYPDSPLLYGMADPAGSPCRNGLAEPPHANYHALVALYGAAGVRLHGFPALVVASIEKVLNSRSPGAVRTSPSIAELLRYGPDTFVPEWKAELRGKVWQLKGDQELDSVRLLISLFTALGSHGWSMVGNVKAASGDLDIHNLVFERVRAAERFAPVFFAVSFPFPDRISLVSPPLRCAQDLITAIRTAIVRPEGDGSGTKLKLEGWVHNGVFRFVIDSPGGGGIKRALVSLSRLNSVKRLSRTAAGSSMSTSVRIQPSTVLEIIDALRALHFGLVGSVPLGPGEPGRDVLLFASLPCSGLSAHEAFVPERGGYTPVSAEMSSHRHSVVEIVSSARATGRPSLGESESAGVEHARLVAQRRHVSAPVVLRAEAERNRALSASTDDTIRPLVNFGASPPEALILAPRESAIICRGVGDSSAALTPTRLSLSAAAAAPRASLETRDTRMSLESNYPSDTSYLIDRDDAETVDEPPTPSARSHPSSDFHSTTDLRCDEPAGDQAEVAVHTVPLLVPGVRRGALGGTVDTNVQGYGYGYGNARSYSYHMGVFDGPVSAEEEDQVVKESEEGRISPSLPPGGANAGAGGAVAERASSSSFPASVPSSPAPESLAETNGRPDSILAASISSVSVATVGLPSARVPSRAASPAPSVPTSRPLTPAPGPSPGPGPAGEPEYRCHYNDRFSTPSRARTPASYTTGYTTASGGGYATALSRATSGASSTAALASEAGRFPTPSPRTPSRSPSHSPSRASSRASAHPASASASASASDGAHSAAAPNRPGSPRSAALALSAGVRARMGLARQD